jgi:hypothetical protein
MRPASIASTETFAGLQRFYKRPHSLAQVVNLFTVKHAQVCYIQFVKTTEILINTRHLVLDYVTIAEINHSTPFTGGTKISVFALKHAFADWLEQAILVFSRYVTIKPKSFYCQHFERLANMGGNDNGRGIATLLSTMWHTNTGRYAVLRDLRTPRCGHAKSSRQYAI